MYACINRFINIYHFENRKKICFHEKIRLFYIILRNQIIFKSSEILNFLENFLYQFDFFDIVFRGY